jgi:hypothetical protein
MKTKKRKYRHPQCYANLLGGCGRDLTKEHYISACVLEMTDDPAVKNKTVCMRGCSFLKPGEIRPIGVASMVSNMLCDTHNNALSVYDNHGKTMFAAMQGFTNAAFRERVTERVWHVDGDGLERWLLKCLCGGLYSGAMLIGPDETLKGMRPSPELLRVLLRGRRFPDGFGLYCIRPQADEPLTTDELIMRFEPIRSPGTLLIGGVRVFLFGFQFALILCRTTPEKCPLIDGALYRPEGLVNVVKQTGVRFHWAEGSGSPPAFLRSEPGCGLSGD